MPSKQLTHFYSFDNVTATDVWAHCTMGSSSTKGVWGFIVKAPLFTGMLHCCTQHNKKVWPLKRWEKLQATESRYSQETYRIDTTNYRATQHHSAYLTPDLGLVTAQARSSWELCLLLRVGSLWFQRYFPSQSNYRNDPVMYDLVGGLKPNHNQTAILSCVVCWCALSSPDHRY